MTRTNSDIASPARASAPGGLAVPPPPTHQSEMGGINRVAGGFPLSDRLLRRREVEERTGLSRSSLYRMMDEGTFPRPQRIGSRAVAWRASIVENWIAGRPIANSSDTL